MSASVVVRTDYAKSHAANKVDPVWGAYQAPAGKITLGSEPDGRAYQRQECAKGVLWNGMERADVLTSAFHIVEGTEIATVFAMQLEPGFYAPNPGWSVGGAEIHDNRGTVGSNVGTQANVEMLVSQNGLQLRLFGGDISTSSGAPANSQDRFYSPTFPLEIGAYHEIEFGYVASASRSAGRVRLKIDGDLLVDHVGASLYSGSGAYYKQPYYRDPNQASNRTCAIRYGNLTGWAGAGAWEAAGGGQVPETGPLGMKVTGRAGNIVTVAWTPQQGAYGYRFFTDGHPVAISTNPAQSSTSFSVTPATKVLSMLVLEAGLTDEVKL